MKEVESNDTLVDQVCEQLLQWVFQHGLASTETLNAASLADTFGVSRTPVNMALVRLEGQGLIQRVGGRGWTMVPITLKDIDEIFELRDVLEQLTARKAAENIKAETSEELARIMARMKEASEGQDLTLWLTADRQYHELLCQVADNYRLSRFQEQLNNQLNRLWVGYSAMEGRMAVSYAEHQRVGNAVIGGDADRAAQEALNHTRSLRANLLDIVKNVLIPFLGEGF